MTDTLSANTSATLTDQEVSDAWTYLLGRLLITNQQQTDFDKEGFVWNQLVHRKPGKANWLPAPADQFALLVRTYVPTEPLLNGDYVLPDVARRG